MPIYCPQSVPFVVGCRQAGRPIKRWKYSGEAVDVSHYWCICGKKFNFYDGSGKTWTVPKSKLKPKSTGMCKGICKKFRVKKPADTGRYEAGQALCQICEIWIDRRGAHIRDGLPATEKSTRWFCNCCNNRVKKNPTNAKYMKRLRSKTERAGESVESIKSRIPKDHELTHVILRICKDGKPHAIRGMLDEIADEFRLEGE